MSDSERSKVKKNGVVVGRSVVVRQTADGFHGPLGSSVVRDVTDDLDTVYEHLEDGKVNAARARLAEVLSELDVYDTDTER